MEITQLDLFALCGAVRTQLETSQERFNRLDTSNGNHGDHLLAVWERIEQVALEHSDAAPETLLDEIAKSLGQIAGCNTARAYLLVCNRLAQRFANGSLTLDVVVDLARRLVRGVPPGGVDAAKARSAGQLVKTLMRGLGGQSRLGKLAEAYGVSEILAIGLDAVRAAEEGRPPLQAGVAFLVSNSPLGYVSHRKISTQLILQTLLVEINRQTGE